MLACKRQRVEERIHQIGLAAADAAPHVQTIDRGPRLTAEPAARRRGDQLVIHALQSVDRACLRGIATEAASREVLLVARARRQRSEEHTSELQSLMRISYAVFCLKKKKK